MKKVNIEEKIKELLKAKELTAGKLRCICSDAILGKALIKLIAPAYGLNRNCFGTEFKRCNTIYKIVGINEKSRVAPIMVESRSKSRSQLSANVVRKALAENHIGVVGIEAAKYREDIEVELQKLQRRNQKIIDGRIQLSRELPKIESDEYFDSEWSVEENVKAIGGFTKRRASVIAQWTEASNTVKCMAVRRIAAFVASVYQIEPWKAYYAASKSFDGTNFSESIRITEKYLVKMEEEFSDPQIVEMEQWMEDILSGRRPLLVTVR